jgi:AcrR family transcriptional regulator
MAVSRKPVTSVSNGGEKTPAAKRIVAAARRYFFSHGFRSVTMDDIAAELGMSKKTLYSCFSSKSEILEAVLLDKFQEIDADLGAITSENPKDAMAVLERLLLCSRRHTEEIQPAFVRDLRRESPDLFKLIETRRRAVIQQHFGRVLSQGRKAGIFRRDISSRMIVEILLGATEAIMNPAKMAELAVTPKTGMVAILSVILEGVIVAPAKKKKGAALSAAK